MSNKIKTYIVNGLNPSISLLNIDITGYKGLIYYLSGPGGDVGQNFLTPPGDYSYLLAFKYGGSAGYVNSGYVDFDVHY